MEGPQRGAEAGEMNLIRQLVEQLRPAPRREYKAPKYSGVGNVEIYIRQFQDVANANGWGEEATLLHLRGALEEGARDCGAAENTAGIYAALRTRFGLTPREARLKLANAKRDVRMGLTEFAKQVRELTQVAYADLPEPTQLEMTLDSFCNGVNNTALQQGYLIRRPDNLEEAVNRGKELLQLHSRTPTTHIHQITAEGASGQVEPSLQESDGLCHTSRPTDSSESRINQLQSDPLKQMMSMIEELSKKVGNLQSRTDRKPETNEKKEPVLCWFCGKEGHIKRDCRSRKRQQGNANGQQ